MSIYVPKTDGEGINSPLKQTPIRDATILVVGFLSVILVLYFSIGYVTEKTLSHINIETEIKFFSKFSDIETIKTSSELEKLYQRAQNHIQFPLKIGIACDDTPNAFALPGGKILITKGLLDNIQSENGLMFIIGHEIGHFVNRDHLQGFGRQLTMTAVLSLFGLGSEASGLFNLSKIPLRSYQRNQELEADAYGLELLEKTYGHIDGADEFFEHISKKESAAEKVLAQFISTHPPSDERTRLIKKKQAEIKVADSTLNTLSKSILLGIDCK